MGPYLGKKYEFYKQKDIDIMFLRTLCQNLFTEKMMSKFIQTKANQDKKNGRMTSVNTGF